MEGQSLHRHIDPTKKRFQGAYPLEQFPGGWPRAPAVSLNLQYSTSHCFVRIPVLRLGGPSAQILLDHSVNIIMTTGCHDDCRLVDCLFCLSNCTSHRDYDYILASAMKVAKVPATWRINSAVKITFTSWQHETQHGATSGRICQKWRSYGKQNRGNKNLTMIQQICKSLKFVQQSGDLESSNSKELS